ncbi:MAG: ADP-ribosylglycohydrolase family protein [Clostridia bacterium]|nr:ADP-ribosylglycohydrolase family protein [Clostridia bacterium]
MPNDYIERCYAGWLAKLAGIRYGAPIEGWTYHKIREIYGELDGYVVDYNLFSADDDSNGPMIFIRALNDTTCTRDITPQDIAQTWLNYAPYEHGFYWWGGYGRSTEHTAYHNLRAGIPAPRSGSIEQNGAAIAEQIGGQIFIDTWGLVFPNQPELAAEYAGKAASVSHGGNAIYGGQYVAVAISLAFAAKNIREVLEGALNYIPADCEYARVVKDIIRFYDEQPVKNWREAYDYVYANWGYDRYPGNCHIIPNAAVMILSMIYGDGDFDRTLNICNMCGWDTDCNVGNVATIMGVLCGIDKIRYNKWLAPLNDTFFVSCVLGCLNIMDVPWCVAYLAELAYRMAGEEMPEAWKPYLNPDEQYYHFKLPGSTHGFKCIVEADKAVEPFCLNSGEGSLRAGAISMPDTGSFRIARRTYYYPADMHDNRYDPEFTPVLYPGQTISVRVMQAESCAQMELHAALYVRDRNSGELIEGECVKLVPGVKTEMRFDIPSNPHMLIDEMGVRVLVGADKGGTPVVYLDEVRYEGKPKYDVDFNYERMEAFSGLHRVPSQFTTLKGAWTIENGRLMGSTCDYGECYTGDIRWTDYSLEGSICCACEGESALNIRVQGAIRSYAAALRDGKLMIRKNENGYRTLAECAHETETGKTYRFRIVAEGNAISVWENGQCLLSVQDEDHPYLNGCIGCSVRDGARAYFDHLVID